MCSWRPRGSLRVLPGSAPPAAPAGVHETGARPWLTPYAVMPMAALPVLPPGAKRKRPFVYVYDMPSEYTSRMLQYRWGPPNLLNAGCFETATRPLLRAWLPAAPASTAAPRLLLPHLSRRHGKSACTWRMWTADAVANHSSIQFSTYAIESLMHEMMLQSAHRLGSGALQLARCANAAGMLGARFCPELHACTTKAPSAACAPSQDLRPRGGRLFLRAHLLQLLRAPHLHVSRLPLVVRAFW